MCEDKNIPEITRVLQAMLDLYRLNQPNYPLIISDIFKYLMKEYPICILNGTRIPCIRINGTIWYSLDSLADARMVDSVLAKMNYSLTSDTKRLFKSFLGGLSLNLAELIRKQGHGRNLMIEPMDLSADNKENIAPAEENIDENFYDASGELSDEQMSQPDTSTLEQLDEYPDMDDVDGQMSSHSDMDSESVYSFEVADIDGNNVSLQFNNSDLAAAVAASARERRFASTASQTVEFSFNEMPSEYSMLFGENDVDERTTLGSIEMQSTNWSQMFGSISCPEEERSNDSVKAFASLGGHSQVDKEQFSNEKNPSEHYFKVAKTLGDSALAIRERVVVDLTPSHFLPMNEDKNEALSYDHEMSSPSGNCSGKRQIKAEIEELNQTFKKARFRFPDDAE